MAILDTQLTNSRLGLKGIRPSNMPGTLRSSTLHSTSSINGIPNSEKNPSELDLDGRRPAAYLDNPPK